MKLNLKKQRLTILLVFQLIIMTILSLIITKTISKTTREDSIQHMQTITDERAHIIKAYVENAEKTLTYYSKAEQITNLLKNPNDPMRVKKAQEYTENYSADIPDLEGIYVSEWNTHVLAHTNPETVGMITRKDADPLKQLQDAMLAAGDGVYDTGMIISPASGKQIVSMYKAVYDENGDPIGLVGLGIYTEKLINNLNSLKIKGVDEAFYSMINVKDSKYVFNKDSSLVGSTATNRDLKKLCEKFNGQTSADSGYFEYEEKGTDYISTYSYMPEYGWILTIDDTKSEVYSLTKVMRIYMAIFGVAILALIIIFSFINKKQEKVNQKLASTIIKNNKTKESLYTAMFKDVLTDVNNRISFSMDLEEAKASPDTPYYFIMFNINDFSEVNTKHGNDTGDWLLVRTVDILKQVFKKGKIYRTGSDEFVVALQVNDKDTSSTVIIEDASDAHRRLSATQNTPMGKHKFGFKSSVVKKSGNFNTSVITVLKDIINKEDNAVAGKIGYIDMDKM